MLAVLEHFRGSSDRTGKRVIDVGCSTEYTADEFRWSSAATIGIDIDSFALAVAKRRFHDRVAFLGANGQALPFPSGTIDIVVFNHIYEHVVDADAVMAEIVRVLRPGGLAYLGLGNPWGVVEPHYGLQFLSWLPPRAADRYIRLFGRADGYTSASAARADSAAWSATSRCGSTPRPCSDPRGVRRRRPRFGPVAAPARRGLTSGAAAHA